MSVSITVLFCPESLADATDELCVCTEAGRLVVPILARRPPPRLSLDSEIRVGHCFIGDTVTSEFECKNSSSGGVFEIVAHPDDEAFASTDGGYGDDDDGGCGDEGGLIVTPASNSLSSASLAPFTISPARFTLEKGDTVDVRSATVTM
jgi:hypothetical protein